MRMPRGLSSTSFSFFVIRSRVVNSNANSQPCASWRVASTPLDKETLQQSAYCSFIRFERSNESIPPRPP